MRPDRQEEKEEEEKEKRGWPSAAVSVSELADSPAHESSELIRPSDSEPEPSAAHQRVLLPDWMVSQVVPSQQFVLFYFYMFEFVELQTTLESTWMLFCFYHQILIQIKHSVLCLPIFFFNDSDFELI